MAVAEKPPPQRVRIGTAGWNIPKQHAPDSTDPGTHLQRYARRFCAVEINSSFYRPHKPSTYARWAASVPPEFRFAVKMPRDITHIRKLIDSAAPLQQFLSEVQELGSTLGPLLIQLPPGFRFDPAVVEPFLQDLRARFDGDVVCEPRHASWFTDAIDGLLSGYRIARVAADPATVPRAAEPGGWPGIVYRRLHGSPRTYYSPYSPADLDATATRLRAEAEAVATWCIFDNTALGEALHDALALQQRLC